MKKFIITYHMPKELQAQSANSTPEEMQEGMKPWMDWAEKCGEHLIDLGTPLSNAKVLDSKGLPQESPSDVAGYSVLQAGSMDKAIDLLKGHPHVTWNESCQIEIHECMPMPG